MIKRRRLVALVSAIVLVSIGLVALATGLFITRTSYGEEQLRRLIQSQIAAAVRGKVYVGPVSGGFLTGVTIDSFAIRDADNDSLMISTGRITANYDPRDLVDKRIWLRNVEVEHPVMYIRQHASGRWNFKEIFRSYDKKRGPTAPGANFGDYVVIDSARVRNATFVLQMPWSPDDSLRGAKLDSAVRFNLTRGDKEIRRVVDNGKPGFVHTWRWTKLYAVVPHMRIADPDSNKFGRSFVVDTLHALESDPPFNFRNVRGTVRHLGDSIWLNLPHFDLPKSTGAAAGKVVWGSDLPVRYDITVRGDSVSLSDVNWVYPTLPTTGGGKVMLHIKNDTRNLRVIDYALKDMDVRSTGSHLTGDMTFAVGGPVLSVKDLKMVADPVDFDLLRTINGKPFPVDWRGQLYGSVRARGGPLNHFYVDEGQGSWRDAHVPGAVSRFRGKGELDILRPAFTAFHGFDVDVASLDLRSIEYLFPNFPRLGGTVSGTATLDSSWLDVRFANANAVHQDGPGEPTHVTGNGRVTWGAQFMTYDLDLQAQPLSLTMLARSYPRLPLRGVLSGPLKAKGTIADLQVSTTLQGAAGTLTYEGTIDAYPPGYGARGAGQFTNFALQELLDSSRLPAGTVRPAVLNGRFEVAVSGDSLANMNGPATIDITRADVDGLRFFPSRARLRFADGKLHVDTLRVETTAATVVASGGIGLPHGVSDSLRFQVLVDSLGGLRRYLGVPATAGSSGSATDSLSGNIVLRGMARGRIDALDLAGTIAGGDFYIGASRGARIDGTFDVRNALGEPTGLITLSGDTITVAGIHLDTLGATVRFAGKSGATFAMTARADNGPSASVTGEISTSKTSATPGSARQTRVTVTAATLDVDSSAWRLAAPAHVANDSVGLTIDSLVLRNGAGGRIAVRGNIPLTAPVSIDLQADSVALTDIATLAQLGTTARGFATLRGHVSGTRAQPEITFSSNVRDVVAGGLNVERVTATGTYRNRRFDTALDFYRKGTPVLRATAALPIAVTLFSAERLDAPLHGAIRADSADLAILEMLSPSLQRASGTLRANLEIGGSWNRPTIGGVVAIADGDVFLQNLGIRARGIAGSVNFNAPRDSLSVNVGAWSGSGPADRLSLTGYISYANREEPRFDLRLFARNFHALDRRSLATLDISTGAESMRLFGALRAATLEGTMTVGRGTIYLPERDLARKQLVDLSGADLFALLDTTDLRSRRIVPDAPSELVANLRLGGVRINIGDEVWLRSREANVKLGGSLSVTSAAEDPRASNARNGRRSRSDAPIYRLALEGQLNAERGSYTLDLTPAPVRREFQVQRGTITFFGTADNNPYVDINATHNVKRASQTDLTIVVHLVGPLTPYPAIELTSNESYLSPSDLVSYLITGQPTFALGAEGQGLVNQTTSVLLPTLTATLTQELRSRVGAWVDLFQFQGGALSSDQANKQYGSKSFQDYFYGARLGGEKQISNNLFFGFSAGLCSLNRDNLDPNQSALVGFVDALSGKLEYRFTPQLSLQAGSEPSTAAMYCGRSTAFRTLVPTPRQWGLSLLRTWHF